MIKGKLITFEGIDGSGKSTQIKKLESRLKKLKINYITYREPGGTSLSEKIRQILLDKENMELSYISEGLLFAAARAQLVKEKIRPDLDSGKVVICDRFIDSTIAYQGYGRELDVQKLVSINEIATEGLIPDITFLLDIKPENAFKRIDSTEIDRMESVGIKFFKKIRKGYFQIIKDSPERFFLINADQSELLIENEINEIIDEVIK
ncbi:MAG: dTMP kinase [Flammeovirgaceae bacterium]|nr:dTMP kinase [Flammeovirgaceae bacterium]|tara:strand:- start:78 stop:698 length:621 start_codon:yes stop_codon:yes gene_type:complete